MVSCAQWENEPFQVDVIASGHQICRLWGWFSGFGTSYGCLPTRLGDP